ncbi:MAG: antitoxin MazE family protein [Rhizobium sp.]|nr:antitoxin MazE family protein [Rhizobium sp.]
MASSVNETVQRHRDAMRAAGLRPIQIWVPDTRLPGFAEECRRQSLAAAKADAADAGLSDFLDSALDDLLNETAE